MRKCIPQGVYFLNELRHCTVTASKNISDISCMLNLHRNSTAFNLIAQFDWLKPNTYMHTIMSHCMYIVNTCTVHVGRSKVKNPCMHFVIENNQQVYNSKQHLNRNNKRTWSFYMRFIHWGCTTYMFRDVLISQLLKLHINRFCHSCFSVRVLSGTVYASVVVVLSFMLLLSTLSFFSIIVNIFQGRLISRMVFMFGDWIVILVRYHENDI